MTTNPKIAENVKNDKSYTKQIFAIAGACALVAGIAAGSIYLLTRNGGEQTTVITSENATNKNAVLQDGKNEISSGGTYTFTGSISSGKITVDTTEQVKIILDNVSITNTEAESGAAIKCKENSNVTIQLVGKNTITSAEDGINSEGDIKINGDGELAVQSGDDAIHADGKLEIESGTFDLTAQEGLEATYIIINGGKFNINASDDGINAASKSDTYSPTVEINGGDITIAMGQGDTDAIDSNGDLYINGGTLNITAQSPFDYDGVAKYNGGTLIVNGETVTVITNQLMGGGMMGGDRGEMQTQPQQSEQNGQTPPQGGGRMMMRQ